MMMMFNLLYLFQIRYNMIAAQLASYIPTLEKFLLSDDKSAFINALKVDSKERMVLELLTLKLDKTLSVSSLEEKLLDIQVSPDLAEELFGCKILSQLRKVQKEQHIQLVLSLLQEKFGQMSQFNHPKPVDIGHSGQEQLSENKIQNVADFFQNYQEIIQQKFKLVLQNKNLDVFSNYGLKQIPPEIFMRLDLKVKENILTNRLQFFRTFDDKFVVAFIHKFLEEKRSKQNSHYSLPSNIYASLTKHQLELLLKDQPDISKDFNYMQYWFKQNYVEKLDKFSKNAVLAISQKQEKRKLLVQILEQIRKFKTLITKSLEEQTFMELLILDLSLENPKKKLFVQFLQNLYVPCSALSDKYITKVQIKNEQYQSQQVKEKSSKIAYNQNIGNERGWHEIHRYEMVSWNHDKLISEYLVSLFKMEEKPDELAHQLIGYLNEDFLNKICAKVKLVKGESVHNVNSILKVHEIAELRDKKKISILSKNKKIFKVDEDVVLTVRVKNVKSIRVKIFELNLEKSYLQKQIKIDENMNLSFLEPTKCFDYEVENTNPYKQTLYDLPIKQIEKKQAVYIVDLQGEGISSRAVIRKGGIVCLKRTTVAGLELKFYDEEGRRIQSLDLWINSKKEAVKNTYTIPFGKAAQNLNIIAVRESYAELINVVVPAESYSWDIGYIYGSQSFIVGNKAKIAIHPRLKLQDEGIGLKILTKSKITVEITNCQDIKSYYTFDNIQWCPKSDYIVEFPIQSYVKNISITVTAEIPLYCGEKLKLQDVKNIYIELAENELHFINVYLNKKNSEYQLLLLGQNGEVIPNTDLTVVANFLGLRQPSSKLLRTNHEGTVKLGKLSLVTSVQASVQTQSGIISRSWVINDKKSQVNYTSCINYKKGERISLPVPSGVKIDDVVLLKKGVEGLISSNVTSFVAIKQNRLIIEGLKSGSYELYFIPFEVSVNIQILSGKQWEAANQVYCPQKEMVYEIVRSANHLIGLGEAEFSQKDDKYEVKVPLNLPEGGLSETAHAHVLIQNYLSPCISESFSNQKFVYPPKTIIQKFTLKQNQYYNNKTLSQEGSYVENRQNEKKFIGNNLQKPRIFLKRQEIRSTCQQQQVLQKEGAFYPSMNAADAKRSERRANTFADQNVCIATPSSIDSHNNFLASPGILAANIKGEAIEFEIPKGYNNFKVYLLSNDGAIQKEYSLNSGHPGKLKDLRHTGIKDISEDKGWTMSREVYHLHEGQQLKINRDSVWSAVGLSNVAAFAQTKSAKVKQWLISWSSYSPAKKQQVYQKQFCHEINVFIKQKDPQFFKKVVRPYIENKVIKTFVDYALLEHERCLEYVTIDKLDMLNDFQKILLIQYLLAHKAPERAKQIAKCMELKQKINKIPFDEFKRHFDTVINSKKTEDVPLLPSQQYQQPNLVSYNNMNAMAYNNAAYNMNQYANYRTTNAIAMPQQQMSYGGAMQMQQMSYDPFSNVGYIAPQQVSYSQPAQLRNWAMDAENRSYRTDAVNIPVQQLQQQAQNVYVNKSNKRFESSKIQAVPQHKSKAQMIEQVDYDGDQQSEQLRLREKYKQGFKAVQKTKQYTETTYRGIKDPKQSATAVGTCSFWSVLANHLIDNPNTVFLTDSFMHLNQQRQFTLGMCFLGNGITADFDLKNQGESIIISAKNSFSIFIKQLRPTAYTKKFGVMINQRFFDPYNRYIYEEDATSIEKEVSQFVVRKIYSYQTVVTNTSGTNLELQLLLDVPEGSIPIQSHEYTQIKSVIIAPYSTSSFERSFYFPCEGKFSMYSANACRGKQIISKGSPLDTIQVKSVLTTVKMESFNDIIRLGNETDVLEFLATKNIFDPNIFQPESIFWMLKSKSIFQKIISVLRSRCYFNETIWTYSFFHKQLQGVKELFSRMCQDSSRDQFEIPIFEYFPYFSTRTHKFLNESKSTIRNVQFKNTYHKFIINVILSAAETSTEKITFLYYLLLQDRIEEASNLFAKLTEAEKNAHRIQADYFECFLDMYQGYPSFAMARKISSSYINYPIASWRNLFKQVYDLLKDYDSVSYVEEETKVQYKTVVIKEPSELRISIPPNTKIEVFIFSINLELYFSEFPFSQFKDFSTIKPIKSISFAPGNSREEKLLRPQQVKDIVVEIYESKQGKPAQKLDSYHWAHPDLKIKLNENKGNAQVFFKGKQYPGCYCKVYTTGQDGEKYYRDGYTDITGTFKYVLTDVENINKFKILFVTEHGGVILQAKPPVTAGSLV